MFGSHTWDHDVRQADLAAAADGTARFGVRPGDILLAHLGIWSRQDPWAPAVLEPLVVGLKARGLCFATLRAHPRYRALFAPR